MIDDFVELLKDEQSNPNAVLIEILGDDYESWDIIVAVEGPDDKGFYYDFVREALAEKTPKMFPCGGKSSLLRFKEVAEDYDWRRKPKIIYLADRDFDDYLGISHEGVYKTEFYSIESYFTGENYVKYVVEKNSQKPLTGRELSDFLTLFNSNFEQAISAIRMVCALMCEIRAKGQHPQFDDFGLDKIFDLKNGMKKKVRVLEKMTETLNSGGDVSYHQLISRVRLFELSDFKKWVRGKLGLQVTRKVYEISKAEMPKRLRDKLPPSNMFGAEAFSVAKAFIGELPELRDYCRICAA
ncbi:DUF4435 domain-containing protein [Paracoccus angustae]|uniref:DUF4435 domain-containing protein n=1 Tax=Paracoccus angustae TaxID=1671480 RepID=A0ABV7UAC3_9RHOB